MTKPLHRAAIALLFSCAALSAHSQDPGKMLGGFLQGIIKPAAPQNNTPANLLGNLLGVNQQPTQNNTADLVGMLMQSLDQIDEPREVEMGRQLAAILLGAKPLHPDMALQRYVNRLGRWISLQSSRPNLPWSFAVLDDPGFNAFATPGGYVFITKGLVDALADESELAGILAHEVAHVVGKHHLKAIRKTAQAGLLTRAVASQLAPNVAGGLSAQLLSLGRDMYAKGLDQTDELEADREGVALAARAGLDPYGLIAVLQQLRTTVPDNPLFALQLSTHPPTQVRLDQLEQAMGQRLDSYAGNAPLTISQRMAGLGNR